MSKQLFLIILFGVFFIGICPEIQAQEKKVDHTVKLSEKRKAPEKYQPQPQAVQKKYSKNPINRPEKSLEAQIKDLKRQIKELEALPYKSTVNDEKIKVLQKQLATKEEQAKLKNSSN